MERGKLEISHQSSVLFIFEGLIGTTKYHKLDVTTCRMKTWETAFNLWIFDYKICDRMINMINNEHTSIDVVTWHKQPFADLVHNHLWELGVYVQSTNYDIYERLSPRIAMDRDVSAVFDNNLEHTHGYGYKSRELYV
jgi:hypothetical protein